MNLINVQIENREDLGLVVSSRVIAQGLGKRHDHVIRDLENILQNSETPNLGSHLISSSYKVQGQKREYKEYLLTKKGFTLYMFNIQGYNDFKSAYIDKFDEMTEKLKSNAPQLSLKNQIYLEIIGAETEAETAFAVRRLEHEVIKPLENKVEHQKEVIVHMTDEVKLQTQRQFLNEIIKMRGNKDDLIRKRWAVLYEFYEKSKGMRLNARLEAHNAMKPAKKVKSKLQFVDEVLNDIPTLYRIAVKTFEADFKDKLQHYLSVL